MPEQVALSSQPQEMNWLARIFNIIFEPRKAFESLKTKPKWLVPFIIVCLLGMGFYYFAYPIIMSDQMNRIEANEKIPDAQKEMIKERIGQAEHPPLIQLVFQPVAVIFLFLILSGIMFFVFNVLMGGDSIFKRVLSVVSHSYLIGIPASIVHFPLVFIKRTMDIHTSLAILLSVDLKDSFIYRFLDGFDIFTLWQVLVLALGLSVMYNFSFKKSFIPILIMWIILILITALLAGLFAGFGGM
jgi:hypothetical protein